MRLFHKSIPALFLFLLLVFMPVLCAQANSGITLLFDPQIWTKDHTQRVAVANETLYIARQDGLYAYRVGDSEPKQLMDFTKTDIAGAKLQDGESTGPAIAELLSENGALYALDARLTALWRYDEAAASFVMEASFDAKEGIWGDAAGDFLYSNFLLDGGNIYYIARNVMTIDINLMRLDAASGKTELVKTGIRMAAPYAPGVLLVAEGSMGWQETLALLNTATGRLDKKLPLTGDYKGLSYDPATDTVYLARKGEIFISQSFQTPKVAARTPILSPLAQGALLSGHLALPYEDGVRIYSTDPSTLADVPLKVAGQTYELPMEAFSAANPEVTFSFIDAYPETTADLVMHMMGGDSAADIYALYISNYSLDDLYEKGYSAGLEDSELIQGTVSAMYPFLKDALIRDGQVIALPFYNSYTVYVSNPRAFEYVGFTEADVPQTYDDLLDLIKRWGEEYAEQFPSMSLFGQGAEPGLYKRLVAMAILEDRMYACLRKGEPVTYDTKEMQALLEKLMDTDFSVIGALTPPSTANDYETLDDWPKQLFQIWYPASAQTAYTDFFSFMPLKLHANEQPVVLADTQVLLINPYTQNYDTALKFVEFAAASLPQTLRTDLMPGENEPLRNSDLESTLAWYEEEITLTEKTLKEAKEEDKHALQDRLDFLRSEYDNQKRFEWQATLESIAALRKLDPCFMLKKPNPIYGIGANMDILSLFSDRFLDGQISSAQFLKELDQKISMMEKEN